MNQKRVDTYFPVLGRKVPVGFSAVVAHPDDIEILATDGIMKGLEGPESFAGIVVTDGGGSARSNDYLLVSDAKMKSIRVEEQKAAAELGRYHAVSFLHVSSAEAKDKSREDITKNIADWIQAYRPHTLYTHNPFDKHPTHVAVFLKTLQAIRNLPKDSRPSHIYGVEGWRDLDWLPDSEKVVFNVSMMREMTKKQLQCYASQVAGGKRYDLATEGRRLAQATYYDPHTIDQVDQLIFAVDLQPLVDQEKLDVAAFVKGMIYRFEQDVLLPIQS